MSYGGKGYLKGIHDLGNIVLKTKQRTPVLAARTLPASSFGPRRTARASTELNGEGEGRERPSCCNASASMRSM